jgi:hypothetical protein
MKKLKLEDLAVDSFSTTAEMDGRATVRAHSFTDGPECGTDGGSTVPYSKQYTCDVAYAECKTDGHTRVITCAVSCHPCQCGE